MTQQKKNIVLLISFGALCLVSFLLFWISGDSSNEIDPTLFRLTDSKAVNKVVFERDTSKIELEFLNNKWRVNKTLDADRNLVDVLFATMAQAVPKREVASRVRDSVMREIKQQGVKVDFYAGESVDKTIWVWGDESQNVTYFTDNEESTPYLMVIPGYRVFVGGIFLQPAGTWRDKRIFNFNWRNFTELTSTFPNDPNQSFKVILTADKLLAVEGVVEADTTVLSNFMQSISLIEADAFYQVGESPRYDSLIQTKPIMMISVKELSGTQEPLELFTIVKDERNALARWGDDYVWFDRRNILQLYKKKKDFVKRAEP
jgi:hypothetical protein